MGVQKETDSVTGHVLFVDNTFQNLNQATVEGLDIEASYRWQLGAAGDIDVRFLAGHMSENSLTNSLGGKIEKAGEGILPKWTATTSARYTNGPYSLGLSARYIGGSKLNLLWEEGVDVDKPTSAHHSRTMFDSDITKVLHGSIVEFDFVNPHAFIILKVENEDGTSTNWELEGTNAMGLVRDGWRPSSLQAGDVIEVEIHPLRSGAPGGEWRAGDVRLFETGSDVGIPPLERGA